MDKKDKRGTRRKEEEETEHADCIWAVEALLFLLCSVVVASIKLSSAAPSVHSFFSGFGHTNSLFYCSWCVLGSWLIWSKIGIPFLPKESGISWQCFPLLSYTPIWIDVCVCAANCQNGW